MRECYVRAVVVRNDREFVAGLEYRDGDNLGTMRDELCAFMLAGPLADEMTMATRIEAQVVARYPDRAYFLEVSDAEKRGWTQIYETGSWVKERCRCAG